MHFGVQYLLGLCYINIEIHLFTYYLSLRDYVLLQCVLQHHPPYNATSLERSGSGG